MNMHCVLWIVDCLVIFMIFIYLYDINWTVQCVILLVFVQAAIVRWEKSHCRRVRKLSSVTVRVILMCIVIFSIFICRSILKAVECHIGLCVVVKFEHSSWWQQTLFKLRWGFGKRTDVSVNVWALKNVFFDWQNH